jgi:SAM-dependent methyltransferase
MDSYTRNRVLAYNEILGRLDDLVALESVRELGIFALLLHGPMSLQEIASSTSTNPERLRPFIDLVVKLGFLLRTVDGIALLPGDEAVFGPQGPCGEDVQPGSLEAMTRRRGQAVSILRHDTPLASAATGHDVEQEKRDEFLAHVHAYSRTTAIEVAQILGHDGVRRIADLGCGPGTYTAALLDRCPHASSVSVDRAQAKDFVTRVLKEAGHADRSEFFAGDMLKDDFGHGFDLILGSEIVHNFGVEQNRLLVRRAAERLKAGGCLAIKDAWVEPDRSGPLAALRFGVALAIFAHKGTVYTSAEVVEWMSEAGLTYESTHRLESNPDVYVVVGRKA